VTFEFGGDVSDLEKTRRGGGGILTYTVDQVERVDSRHDLLAFGLRTRQTSDATLVHVTSDNSNDYIRLEMVSLRSFILTYLLTYFKYCATVRYTLRCSLDNFLRFSE